MTNLADSHHYIQSLDKGLHLLEVIEQASKPITLSELWAKLRWDKATIHRLLATLERRGYLVRNEVTKAYSLGLKIYGLYSSLKKNSDIQQVTRPYLVELANATGEAAHLAVVVERQVVFIDRMSSSETLSVNTQIGAREPLHCTALGKAYLAFLDQLAFRELFPDGMEKYTSRTITTEADLARALAKARRNGYAVDDEEYIDGIRCVASPILNEFSSPIAAIGVSGPKYRMPREKIITCGRTARDIALKISRHYGYVGKIDPSGVH